MGSKLKKAYMDAKQRYKDVTKGGKDYASCSFMDISVRADYYKKAREEYIIELGTKKLEKLEGE